jgi:small GTP-binding protein
MIGAPAVGKTSLVRRFVYDLFDDKYLTTIGVKISQKVCPPIQVPNEKPIQYTLMVWDIEGTEEMRSAIKNYYRGASGALLVSDLSRMDTIELIPQLMEGFQEVSPEAEVILVGNKLDLVKPNEKTLEALAGVKSRSGFQCFLTSAKSGQNVEAAFFKFSELFALER